VSVTVTAIMNAALQRADMENSSYAGATELYGLINAEGAELHDLLVSRLGEDYFLTSTTATVAAGANTITLGATVYKVRGVDRDEGGGQWCALRSFSWDDRNRRSAGPGWYMSSSIRYRVQGSVIYLTPTQS
jgi:hypothetical protein